MSILDTLPHVCDAKIRTIVRGSLGGSKTSETTVTAGLACWRQQVSEREARVYEKRGIDSIARFFFTADPGLDERHTLTDVRDKDATAGTGDDWDIVSKAEPDRSAGLGIVWGLTAVLSTTGETEQS